MIQMNVLEEDHSIAFKRTKEVLKALEGKGLKSRFNTDEFENKYLGFLGESVFSRYLLSHNISFLWDNNKFGEADDYDFLINNKRVDVKTDLRKNPIDKINDNFNILLTADQVGKKADYYVWIFVNSPVPSSGKFAYLMGFLGTSKLFDYQPEILKGFSHKSLVIPINDLFPIREFINVVIE